MVEFTFFEIHLDDARLTANAPFSSASPEEADSDAVEAFGEDGTDDEGGPGVLPFVVGLLVLIAIAVVVKKLLGSGGEVPDIEDFEDE